MSIAMVTGAVILAVVTAASAQADSGRSMGAAEIAKTFRGITLDGIYSDGSVFSETYFDDGSLRYHDVTGADSGDWSIEGDLFCTFYERLEGGCFFVIRQGDNCFIFFDALREADGEILPRENWTSRGWNRRRDATCGKPPEAAI